MQGLYDRDLAFVCCVIDRRRSNVKEVVNMDNVGPEWVWYASGLFGIVAAAGYYGLHLRGGERVGGVSLVDTMEGAPAEPVGAGD